MFVDRFIVTALRTTLRNAMITAAIATRISALLNSNIAMALPPAGVVGFTEIRCFLPAAPHTQQLMIRGMGAVPHQALDRCDLDLIPLIAL